MSAAAERGTTARRVLATVIIAAVVVAADQVTKSLALEHVHGPTHLFGPLGLDLTFNSGAAFSLLAGATGIVVAVALVLVALLGMLALRTSSYALAVAIGLLLGGALSNLADRVFRPHHGEVEDFITLTHWPTFNIADASITLGAVLVVILVLFGRAKPFSR